MRALQTMELYTGCAILLSVDTGGEGETVKEDSGINEC